MRRSEGSFIKSRIISGFVS